MTIDMQYNSNCFDNNEYQAALESATEYKNSLFKKDNPEFQGWLDRDCCLEDLRVMKAKALELQQEADIFIVIGVGGSNQAARSLIESIAVKSKVRVLFAGNTLSSYELNEILNAIESKSVYINCIAKNFKTLEPGSHFRVIREHMAKRWQGKELSKRIIVTGTEGSLLHNLACDNDWTFLHFPQSIGGRYSALSSVGLFPLLVAHFDVDSYIDGYFSTLDNLKNYDGKSNPAIKYAVSRYLNYKAGKKVEILSFFEPRLNYFAKWWRQLFGESEGKDQKGIYPSICCFSEDLHSMGQYIQDGSRILQETFIRVKDAGINVLIPQSSVNEDFDYPLGLGFNEINKIAQLSTIEAHASGDVPVSIIEIDEISERAFGELFAFFMVSCVISSGLLGVNPYDQEGVEKYKTAMFEALHSHS